MILESCHIDHTNLKPMATGNDICKLCDEAKRYNFRGVCVHPCHVDLIHRELIEYSDIKIVTVIGFPLGANTTQVKIVEAQQANNKVDEIDVVWDLGLFKAKKYLKVLEQLTEIIDAVDCEVKVIVETCYLDYEEIEKAYQIVLDSGADYIKTSTGFGPSEIVTKLSVVSAWNKLRRQNNDNLKIKAAGGIGDYISAQYYLDCGADVIGTSHGVKIMEERYASSKLSS